MELPEEKQARLAVKKSGIRNCFNIFLKIKGVGVFPAPLIYDWSMLVEVFLKSEYNFVENNVGSCRRKEIKIVNNTVDR